MVRLVLICKNEGCDFAVLGSKFGICDLCEEEEWNSSDWEDDEDPWELIHEYIRNLHK